jgi:nucleoid-associated protein YgaU
MFHILGKSDPMMPQKEYDDLEETFDHTVAGKSPGVYLRSPHPNSPSELDMLYSGHKFLTRDERSPFVFFFIGLVVGAVITALTLFLLNSKPQANPLNPPKAGEAAVSQPADPSAPMQGSSVTIPGTGSSQALGNGVNNAGASGTTYVVQSGDTLDKISLKFYGSSDPSMVEKLKTANKLTNPNQIRLEQTLVVPPKDY